MSYNKTVWHTGDIVHADLLNNIEEGIKKADEKLERIEDGAQVNVIEGIQFNGTDVTPDSETKKVNISAAPYDLAVPIGTSEDIGKILGKNSEGFSWIDKPLDGTTPHIDQDSKHWMIGEEDTNVDAEGKNAYQVAVSQGYEGTESQWLASLKGDKGDNAVNPFKGYFGSLSDLQTKFSTGQNGDFANVYDTTADKTYRYVWNATQSDWVQALDSSSQPIEVTPSTATFNTGESVVDTSITDDALEDSNELPTTKAINSVVKRIYGDDEIDFAISDADGNAIMELAGGHIKTKEFDSSTLQVVDMVVEDEILKITL